jgi:signal peptidase I
MSIGADSVAHPHAIKPSYLSRSLPLLLSVLWPGLGQIKKTQTSRGWAYGIAFFVTITASTAFRFPTHYLPLMLTTAALVLIASLALLDTAIAKPRPPVLMFVVALPLELVVLNLVFWLIFALTGTRLLHMPSISMQPTILLDERVIADYRTFETAPPQRGQLVIFDRKGTPYLKRVIAIAGDTVQVTNQAVTVNGTRLMEPYAATSSYETEEGDFGPATVPANHLFVLGDNRGVSLDSRRPEIGFVSNTSALGRPLYVVRSPRTERLGQELR